MRSSPLQYSVFLSAAAALCTAPLAAQSRPGSQVPATAPQVAAADPVANPAATIVDGHARFTLLTPRLVRMEWSADGRFEDRASLVFIQRHLPVPRHTVRRAGGWLTIHTDDLTLRY